MEEYNGSSFLGSFSSTSVKSITSKTPPGLLVPISFFSIKKLNEIFQLSLFELFEDYEQHSIQSGQRKDLQFENKCLKNMFIVKKINLGRNGMEPKISFKGLLEV